MGKVLTDYEAAAKHRYRIVSGGSSVPGVTTCIGILDKPGLAWAASKIAAETMYDGLTCGLFDGYEREDLVMNVRGEFDRVWKEKAARGNRVHEIADRWTRGETVEVRDSDAGFVDALEMFHHGYQPKFLHTESIVLNKELGFGGRLDFIGELDGPEAQGVILADFKSGSERPLETALQASGYWNSLLASYDESGALTGLQDLPKLDGARTIYLREDGSFKVVDPFEHISLDQAWEMFQACLTLFKVNKQLNAVLKQGERNAE